MTFLDDLQPSGIGKTADWREIAPAPSCLVNFTVGSGSFKLDGI
jgi:hypothetical protein